MTLRAKTSRRNTSIKESILKAATNESTCRLNAEIPESLHRRLKVYAAEKRSNITEIVVAALGEYLSKNSSE